MGSPAIAAWIAHAAFWVLLVYGFAIGEVGLRRLAIFIFLWCAGLTSLPYIPYESARAIFSSFVAVLDVALVFTIFKGDVRLT